MNRPYTVLSCAMSLDGYIDDSTRVRLRLSGEADIDRVDETRASCDAILVGAETIRADNPRLILRSEARRQARVARGVAPDPVKVTLTGTGDLDPASAFFTAGTSERLVYAATGAVGAARERCGSAASVIDAGDPVRFPLMLADLAARRVGRLLVEGGSSVLTQFLTSALADELHLVIAPFFVGDSGAPRFVDDGSFPWTSRHPARLVEARQVGQDVLLRYALSERYGSQP